MTTTPPPGNHAAGIGELPDDRPSEGPQKGKNLRVLGVRIVMAALALLLCLPVIHEHVDQRTSHEVLDPLLDVTVAPRVEQTLSDGSALPVGPDGERLEGVLPGTGSVGQLDSTTMTFRELMHGVDPAERFKGIFQGIKERSDRFAQRYSFRLYVIVTLALLLLGVLLHLFGPEGLASLIGPPRWKKIIIDIFIVKGEERTFYPTVKATEVRGSIRVNLEVPRLQLHDIIRVRATLEGPGRLILQPHSVQAEGRSAYNHVFLLGSSGCDYYFNISKVTTRSVRLAGDMLLAGKGSKGRPGRVRFDIWGFQSKAW